MKLFLVIGISGFIGAVSRYYLSLLICNSIFPWGTLFVNILGSFLLAFFLTIALSRFEYESCFVIAISVGFIGSFTTFSTLSIETVKLLMVNPLLALTYIAASLMGGLFMGYIGKYLGGVLALLIAGDDCSKEANN